MFNASQIRARPGLTTSINPRGNSFSAFSTKTKTWQLCESIQKRAFSPPLKFEECVYSIYIREFKFLLLNMNDARCRSLLKIPQQKCSQVCGDFRLLFFMLTHASNLRAGNRKSGVFSGLKRHKMKFSV